MTLKLRHYLAKLAAALAIAVAAAGICCPTLAQEPDIATYAADFDRIVALAGERKYQEAAELAVESLARADAELDPGHPVIGVLSGELARISVALGRYDDAQRLYLHALDLLVQAGAGQSGPAMGLMGDLGDLYVLRGEYDQAETVLEYAYELASGQLGEDHLDIAALQHKLGNLARARGRYTHALSWFQRAATIVGSQLPDSPESATLYHDIAGLYLALGRYGEAEDFLLPALAIEEAALGADHPDVAGSLRSLARVHRLEGRLDDSEALLARALAIHEAALGASHPETALTLEDIGAILVLAHRYEEAREPLERAALIAERAYGAEAVRTAEIVALLGVVDTNTGNHERAEALLRRALGTLREVYGEDHIETTVLLDDLAELDRQRGRFDEAARWLGRALIIRERFFEPQHPAIAQSHYHLATVAVDRGDLRDALRHIRMASAIFRARMGRADPAAGGAREAARARPVFQRHVSVALQVAADSAEDEAAALIGEALEAAQLAMASRTAATISRMALRFSLGDDALAELLRARQDAIDTWTQLDRFLIEAVSVHLGEGLGTVIDEIRAEMDETTAYIGSLDARLEREFPNFAEMLSLQPLALEGLQALLDDDEALLTYLVDDDVTYLWTIRHDRASLERLPIGAEKIAQTVRALRTGLDPTSADIPFFNLELAHQFYQSLMAPAEPLLDGVSHLILALGGDLQSLPFSVLLRAPPDPELSTFQGYQQAAWLVRDFAMSVVPSVGTLHALRTLAPPSTASLPLVAFADPVFEGPPGPARGVDVRSLFGRGGIADPSTLSLLPRLPDSAEEVRAIAAALGSGEEALFLSEAANEAAVRDAPLDDARVIVFATHGLMAGEFGGFAEPSLALTPSQSATPGEDGLLTASEIAGLRLDADLVILSACNTAAADGTPHAEGFSGLAKAFFYAGSRSLMVSHWSVLSAAAKGLTTAMFEQTAAGMTAAEALQTSMLHALDDPGGGLQAHPMYWAPFVLVGDGTVVPFK